MSTRKHQLSNALTALTIGAFALTALGIPTKTPDPISVPALSVFTTLGVPTNGGDPVSAPAIFPDPLGF